jgi:hypothetical protein
VRDGQRLVSLDPSNEPLRPTALRVHDGASERVITYTPARDLALPQYEINREAYAADARTCLAWFGATPPRSGTTP